MSSPAFLRTVEICLVYSLSAKMICAFKVNSDDKFPTGSLVLVPSFKINSFGTISIIVFPSGTSMSLTCIMACPTSRTEIPAYLSFNSFVTLFCTMVAYFPGMVTYAELILNLASSSAFSIVFAIERAISSSFIIFPFLIPSHLLLVEHIISI